MSRSHLRKDLIAERIEGMRGNMLQQWTVRWAESKTKPVPVQEYDRIPVLNKEGAFMVAGTAGPYRTYPVEVPEEGVILTGLVSVPNISSLGPPEVQPPTEDKQVVGKITRDGVKILGDTYKLKEQLKAAGAKWFAQAWNFPDREGAIRFMDEHRIEINKEKTQT